MHMTQSPKQPRQRRTRRWTREGGLPYLLAEFPDDFSSATAVNNFIYTFSAEIIVGRLETRTATVLGYLAQLAIQTLPLLRIEAELTRRNPTRFEFISLAPKTDLSPYRSTPPAAPATQATPQTAPNNSPEGAPR